MTLDIPVAGTSLDPGLFSGKRRAPRMRRTLPVECRGPGGMSATGCTVDVSKGGMLLEMTDPRFKAPTDASLLVSFATRLSTSFPDGMQVSFGEGAVRAHATIVRLVTNSTGTTPILLGCRFDPQLAEVDCALLGLNPEGDETSKSASDPTPVAAKTPTRAASNAKSAEPTSRVFFTSAKDELLCFIEDGREGGAPWVEDVDDRAEPWGEVALRDASASATPRSAPARGEGLTVEDLKRIDDRRARAATTDVRVPFSEPTEDDTVVYVFPMAVPFLGPRYRGRLVEVAGREVSVDMHAPAGEADVVGWAAGIGVDSRLVCMREGRVLWETRANVEKLAPAGPGEVRATLVAEREASMALRVALLPLAPV